LKMNQYEIKEALMSMDSTSEKGLSSEKLKAIQLNIPTAEEMNLIDSYDGDKSELGNAEKYFIAVNRIPLLAIRVDSLEYKSSFDTKSKELLQSFNIILAAIKIVKTDKRFHGILELILGLGNYLNGSTSLGQTYGFKLQSLVKIADVRSPKNPSFTLLHYLADTLYNHYKDYYACLKEFGPVHEAARESTSEVGKQVIALSTGIQPILKQLESATCDAAYSRSLSSWAPQASKLLEDLKSKNTAAQEGLKEVLNLYGEPNNTKSEDFFGLLSSFVTSIEQAYIMNEKKRAEAAKEKKGPLIKSPKPKVPGEEGAAGPGAAGHGPAGKGQGEYDRMLANMKGGAAFSRKAAANVDVGKDAQV